MMIKQHFIKRYGLPEWTMGIGGSGGSIQQLLIGQNFPGRRDGLLPGLTAVEGYTPGTLIPIISEQEAHALRPDAFVVLPWHFRENLLEREAAYLASGGEMIFPLPKIEVVGLANRASHRI